METPRGAKRGEILVAVWRVVAGRGLNAVSVRSVAGEAGVSAGRVQHYFATKDELVRASVEFMIEAAARAHDESTCGATPEERLWAVLSHALPRAANSRAGAGVFYSFVAAAVSDPHIAATLAEAKSGTEREIARLLREVRSGLAASDDEARRLLAVADGLTMRVLVGSLTGEEAESSLRAAIDGVLA